MILNFIDMLNPKGGRGLIETIVAVILIVGLLTLNLFEVEVSKMIEYVSILFFGYLWGNRPEKKEVEKVVENEK